MNNIIKSAIQREDDHRYSHTYASLKAFYSYSIHIHIFTLYIKNNSDINGRICAW